MTEAGASWRRLFIPAVTTALMLALAIGLGIWQLQRLAWKTGLLADIDRAEAARAIPLPADPPMFAKVAVTGSWLAGRFALYGADVADTPAGPKMGARLIMALQRDDGALPVLVDRGWVPTERAGGFTALGEGGSGESVSVEGYVRLADRPGLFVPADAVAEHRFYTLDPATIGPSMGLARVAPFVLVALGPATQGVYPRPAQSLPRPPNDHLSYAITWFSLGLVLVVIFLMYARKVLRA